MSTIPPPAPSAQAPAPAAATPAELTQKYIQLRAKVKEISDRHKAELEPYKNAMDRLEGVVLDYLRSQGIESMRTEFGTAYYSVAKSFKVSDGPQFFQHCINTGQMDLLEQRCAKSAVEEYIEKHGTLPPGVSASQSYVVGFRKA